VNPVSNTDSFTGTERTDFLWELLGRSLWDICRVRRMLDGMVLEKCCCCCCCCGGGGGGGAGHVHALEMEGMVVKASKSAASWCTC